MPAFFLPWLKPWWLKALVLCFPVLMLTSLVYLGEHWVVDGLVGWVIVGATFLFWNRMERRTRPAQGRAGPLVARHAGGRHGAGPGDERRMNPPTVLLERSFVAALLDPADPEHEVAARCYLDLVAAFGRDERLLAVTSDTRRRFGAATDALLAPATTLHVAGQERHAAEHVRIDGVGETHAELALNLVVLHRHKIATVATFDPRYRDFDIEVLPASASE